MKGYPMKNKVYRKDPAQSPGSILVILFLGITIAIAGAQGEAWYRGNTHSQTTLSDGKTSPDYLVESYIENGYDFLCITDHHAITRPGSFPYTLPEGSKFLLIPSEEITGDTHVTAMNIRDDIRLPESAGTHAQTLAMQVAAVEHQEGLAIANHPNYLWMLAASDIRAVPSLVLMEIHNALGLDWQRGDARHPSVESIWDELLSEGRTIYGVASDDAHSNQTDICKGWVMVRAASHDADSIVGAMRRGDFYASSGVLLKTLEAGSGMILVEVDLAATEREIAKKLTEGTPAPKGAEIGERIDFIGPGGEVLRSVQGLSASCTLNGAGYLRARITVTRPLYGRMTDYRAWTQPIFAASVVDP